MKIKQIIMRFKQLCFFRKMICEQRTLYTFRDKLARSHINLLIHEVLKAFPSAFTNKETHQT